MPEIATRRLLLRQWRDAAIDRRSAQIAEKGWGNWAVEVAGSGEFIGFVGLTVPRRVLPFSPCVEVGWRLARRHCLYRIRKPGSDPGFR